MSDPTIEVTSDSAGFAMVPYWMLESSGPALRLYVLLLKYADNKTRVAWPSRATLAKELGYSRSASVDPLIAELESMGAVEVLRNRTENGLNEANRYHVRLVRKTVPVQKTVPVRSSGPSSTVKPKTVVRKTVPNLEPMNYNQELEPIAPALFETPNAVAVIPASSPAQIVAKRLYDETRGALKYPAMMKIMEWGQKAYPEKRWEEIGNAMMAMVNANTTPTQIGLQRVLDGKLVPGRRSPVESTTDARVRQGMSLTEKIRAREAAEEEARKVTTA